MGDFHAAHRESFFTAALEQTDLITSVASILLAFAVLTLLRAFGLMQQEVRVRLRQMWAVYAVIALSVTSVVLGFAARMAVTGHHFKIGVELEPFNQEKLLELGSVVTWLAVAQIAVCILALGVLIVWIFSNRRKENFDDEVISDCRCGGVGAARDGNGPIGDGSAVPGGARG